MKRSPDPARGILGSDRVSGFFAGELQTQFLPRASDAGELPFARSANGRTAALGWAGCPVGRRPAPLLAIHWMQSCAAVPGTPAPLGPHSGSLCDSIPTAERHRSDRRLQRPHLAGHRVPGVPPDEGLAVVRHAPSVANATPTPRFPTPNRGAPRPWTRRRFGQSSRHVPSVARRRIRTTKFTGGAVQQFVVRHPIQATPPISIARITRPRPGRGVVDQPGTNRIEVNVPRHGPEVTLIFHGLSPMEPLEHVPAKTPPSRLGVGVGREEPFHSPPQLGLGRLDDDV